MKPMAAISKGPPQIYRRDIDVVEEVLTVSGYRWEWITIVPIKNLSKIASCPFKFACE